MARLNTKLVTPRALTHEGAPAHTDNPIRELRRAVLSCLLWEDTFYESGEDIATRIQSLVKKCVPSQVATSTFKSSTDPTPEYGGTIVLQSPNEESQNDFH